MSNDYAVILAGGKGERFWPLSTASRPKQLLALVSEKTLLTEAIERLDGLIPPERVYVITNQELVEACREAAPALPADQVVGEPFGRDTAAAVALAAALIEAREPGAAFCVLTADHVIGDLPLYRQTLAEALALAVKEEVLITIGIRPAEASTAYGYIEAGDEYAVRGPVRFRKASRFVEKPDAERAAAYLESGDFFWNSGMFVWSARTVHQAFARHHAPLADMMDGMQGLPLRDIVASLPERYGALDKISIDYALMEKADNIIMAEGCFAWDDVGSWTALANHFEADVDGNVVIGEAEQIDSEGNLVYSRDRLTALVGVRDLIVVQAEGVTLVCPRERAQEIKSLVAQLRNDGRHPEAL